MRGIYLFQNIEGVEIGDIIEVYEGNILDGYREWIGPYTDIPAMGDDNSEYTSGYCKKGYLPRFKLNKLNGEQYWLTGDIKPWKNNELFISNVF